MIFSLPGYLAELLATSPSIQAAVAAAKETKIAVDVIRACQECDTCRANTRARLSGEAAVPESWHGLLGRPCQTPRRVERLGVVSTTQSRWRADLTRLATMARRVGSGVVQFTYHGRDYERPIR
jgi:hypothetical protein